MHSWGSRYFYNNIKVLKTTDYKMQIVYVCVLVTAYLNLLDVGLNDMWVATDLIQVLQIGLDLLEITNRVFD